jgi:hypothetical protein
VSRWLDRLDSAKNEGDGWVRLDFPMLRLATVTRSIALHWRGSGGLSKKEKKTRGAAAAEASKA